VRHSDLRSAEPNSPDTLGDYFLTIDRGTVVTVFSLPAQVQSRELVNCI
jgi:hypothetical protein